MPNAVMQERFGLNVDFVTRIENGILKCFGHVERMLEEIMTN